MATTNIPRNYNLSDAELCSFTSNLCITMQRDIVNLTPFGITVPIITSLKALGDAFEIFQPDDFYIGDVMIATQDKLAKMEVVKETIRNMAMRVALKWGENSGQYRRLGITGMNNFTEEKLLVQARSIHGNMTLWLTDLASTGLTQDLLDDFSDANDAFEAARNAQNTASNVRDNMTELRITKGNELYALVSAYCELGKRVFAVSSPARYNDYIIYSPAAGAITPPTGLQFVLSNMTISWNSVPNATSYTVEASQDNLVYQEIYSGSDTSFVYVPEFFGNTYIKCRARSASGYSDFSQAYNFAYYEQLPAPVISIALISGSGTMYQLSWAPILSATLYKIYKSEVAIGADAGEFTYVADSAGTIYTGNAVTGKRNWFILKSSNATQMSEWSNSVFLDVPIVPA